MTKQSRKKDTDSGANAGGTPACVLVLQGPNLNLLGVRERFREWHRLDHHAPAPALRSRANRAEQD
jgi:hypothetical protein